MFGLRIYWAFLTQFFETDSGTGPNKSAEKKLEPNRASLVLADPAPPFMGQQNFLPQNYFVPNYTGKDVMTASQVASS